MRLTKKQQEIVDNAVYNVNGALKINETVPCILTDFESERWNDKSVNIKSVKECLKLLCEKSKIVPLRGELGHPDSYEIDLNNSTHIISDIFIYKKKIYGNVLLLGTKRTIDALPFLNKADCKIGIRAAGTVIPRKSKKIYRCKKTVFDKIFTFDIIPIPSEPINQQ